MLMFIFLSNKVPLSRVSLYEHRDEETPKQSSVEKESVSVFTPLHSHSP